jgi:hypothetical protein
MIVILTQTRPNANKYVHLLVPYRPSFDVFAIEKDRNKNNKRGNTGNTMLVLATLDPFLPLPPSEMVATWEMMEKLVAAMAPRMGK